MRWRNRSCRECASRSLRPQPGASRHQKRPLTHVSRWWGFFQVGDTPSLKCKQILNLGPPKSARPLPTNCAARDGAHFITFPRCPRAVATAGECFMAARSRFAPLKAGETLKHFVLKSEGRKLYREVLRAIKGLDESTAAGVREAAREQFDDHAHETDVDKIRILIVDGQHSLDQMKSALGCSSPTVRRR